MNVNESSKTTTGIDMNCPKPRIPIKQPYLGLDHIWHNNIWHNNTSTGSTKLCIEKIEYYISAAHSTMAYTTTHIVYLVSALNISALLVTITPSRFRLCSFWPMCRPVKLNVYFLFQICGIKRITRTGGPDF